MVGLDLWRLNPFEALAEIFDFAAGLVQRVPKKPNEMKADLQNSTASQGNRSREKYFSLRLWNLEGSATGDELELSLSSGFA